MLLKRLPKFLTSFDPSSTKDQRLFVTYVSVLFFCGNLSLLVLTTMKYHVWSVMQARLLFPSFSGLLLPFGLSVGELRKYKGATTIFKCSMRFLIACFGLYFVSEIFYRIIVIFIPSIGAVAKRFSSHPGL